MTRQRLPPAALLNKRQAARLLNVSPKTLDRLRAQGLIETVKIGSRALFRPEEVAAYIARNSTHCRGD